MKLVTKALLLGGLALTLFAVTGCSHSAPPADDFNASGQPAVRHKPRGANPV